MRHTVQHRNTLLQVHIFGFLPVKRFQMKDEEYQSLSSKKRLRNIRKRALRWENIKDWQKNKGKI